ncbi:hypothetical protein [Sphingomonas sanxanigenens]|uniref:Uncharacterized protein n=1 Tax=Sphingomonas sanxanigenens DSM 19645 = NX02 TaxID=1123269 RepID=W0A4N6_9SPHN|nr:hypothetical protein [Sphingomonas sanxanigenens]AHE52924.1 hypothetical protein NX02_05945 [Sphingomonas sanxanigenens DSM 19645 = NX02]
MEREGRIDWLRLTLGVVNWELGWPALDDARFERILAGFASHYVVTRTSSDAFAFERGEGFDKFRRFDAFAYVDSGRVSRRRNAAVALDDAETPEGARVMAFPAGWRSIQFELNIRVLLIFWAAALIALKLLLAPGSNWLWWLGGFVAVYAVYVQLAMRSLRQKLQDWLRRESWN